MGKLLAIVLVFALAVLYVLYLKRESTLFWTSIKEANLTELLAAEDDKFSRYAFRIAQNAYRQQAPSRRSMLKGWFGDDFLHFYYYLVPEVFCPGLVRLGRIGDGGKWFCNVAYVPTNCTIFSVGINEEITFDVEIQELIDDRCRLYAFDKDQQSERVHETLAKRNGHFQIAQLTNRTSAAENIFRISDLMRMYNVTKIEILKIDIEGDEEFVLPQLLPLQVCHLLIELHDPAVKTVIRQLRQISSYGYYLYMKEINSGALKVCEYSFIHEFCLDRYKAIPLGRYLDG